MNKQILVITLSLVTTLGFAQVKKPTTVAKAPVKPAVAVNPLKNNTDSVSYSVGVKIAQSMKSQGFDKINMAVFEKAIADVLHNKKIGISDEVINQCIGTYQQKVSAEKAAGIKKEGLAFLALNGKRPGVVTLPDGLQYEVIKTGTDNTHPTLTSKVKCHYHGTLINGTVFDSSVDRGEPITFNLSNVIKGWQEALQLMTVGSKWKLYVPSDLAYGDNAAGPAIGPGSTLIFEVELLGIEN
jgi:FKBP-type peptidyl-prolyl cis-trans isomerase FklB